MDLEEEEEDSIVYTDFIVAQRLQAEEYAQATNGSPLEPPAKRARTDRNRSLLSALRSATSTGSGAGLPNSLDGQAKNGLGESLPIPAPNFQQPSRVPEVTITGGTRAAQASDFISASQLLQQDRVGLGLPSDFSTGVSSNDVTDASDGASEGEEDNDVDDDEVLSDSDEVTRRVALAARDRRAFGRRTTARAVRTVRQRLESFHPELPNLWINLENEPPIIPIQAEQPPTIHRRMKGFQLEGLSWMKQMEASKYKGGILGDEMGLGKTIQAVSLIMSDFPVGKPSLVLVPPVALLQWVSEIDSYTDKTLKTFVYHATNAETKSLKLNELKKYDVIIMSYNSLESMYRRETKGHKKKRKGDACTVEVHKKPSIIHKIDFHRLILDEAHEIKVRRRSFLGVLITSHHLC
jgi:DNA repair protein RAD16